MWGIALGVLAGVCDGKDWTGVGEVGLGGVVAENADREEGGADGGGPG